MARFYTELSEKLRAFIDEQKIFFTATAPEQGRVNLSPKGMDTFRCIDERTVAYLDLTGSGNETAAHLTENGRMTIMFCSFTATPLILRLYGQGRVVRPGDDDWETMHALFTPIAGTRQIIVLAVETVQTSCGHGVPVYKNPVERTMIPEWATKKGEDEMRAYRLEKNRVSIDGLPAHPFDELSLADTEP